MEKRTGGSEKGGLDTTQKRSKLFRICDQNPLHTSAAPTALTELLEIYQTLKKKIETTSPSAQPVLRAQVGMHNCATHSFFLNSGIPEGTTSLTVYFTVRLFLLGERLSACSSTGPQCLCWPTSLRLSVYFKFLACERLAGLSTGIAALLTVPEVLLILVGVNKQPWWLLLVCMCMSCSTTSPPPPNNHCLSVGTDRQVWIPEGKSMF